MEELEDDNPYAEGAREAVARLRRIMSTLPPGPDMCEHKVDAEPVLRELAEIRASIPYLRDYRRPEAVDGRAPLIDSFPLVDEQDFDWLAIRDAVQMLAEDLEAVIEMRVNTAMQAALRLYWAGEEMVKDPANAHLIPMLQQLREAYERDTGAPIPPKPEE